MEPHEAPWPTVEGDVTGRNALVHYRFWPAQSAEPGRPVLVAFHGLFDSGAVFEPLWRALGGEWAVLAPDAPGHGRTPWTRSSRYDMALPAEDMRAVLGRAGELAPRSDGCVVLAHSLSAGSAVCAATTRPDLVRHTVFEEPMSKPWFATRELRRHQAWIRRLQQGTHQDLLAEAEVSGPDWPPAEWEPWARSKAEMDPHLLDVPFVWHDLDRSLRRLKGPVSVVIGASTGGAGRSPRLARSYRCYEKAGIHVVRIDSGHNVRRDNPAAFLDVIRTILRHPSA